MAVGVVALGAVHWAMSSPMVPPVWQEAAVGAGPQNRLLMCPCVLSENAMMESCSAPFGSVTCSEM